MYRRILVTVLLVSAVMFLRHSIQSTAEASSRPLNELMYFPSGKSIDRISLDYKSTVSNFLWLQTIQYYGQHMLTDKNLMMLDRLFDVITDLDPNFRQCYTFGATVIAYDQKRPDLGRKLLRKGMVNMSDDWSIPFIEGFIDYVYLRDYDAAYRWFMFAAEKEGAPDYCRAFAASAKKREGDYITAVKIWSEIYSHSENRFEKQKAEYNILAIIMQEFQRNFKGDRAAFQSYAAEESRKLGSLPFGIRIRIENDSVRVEKE